MLPFPRSRPLIIAGVVLALLSGCPTCGQLPCTVDNDCGSGGVCGADGICEAGSDAGVASEGEGE